MSADVEDLLLLALMSDDERTNKDDDNDPEDVITMEDLSEYLGVFLDLDDDSSTQLGGGDPQPYGIRVLEVADFLLLLQTRSAHRLTRRSVAESLVNGDLHRMQRHWRLEGSSPEEIADSFLHRFRRPPIIRPATRNAGSEQEPKFKPDPNRKRKNRPSGMKYEKRAAKKGMKKKKRRTKTYREDVSTKSTTLCHLTKSFHCRMTLLRRRRSDKTATKTILLALEGRRPRMCNDLPGRLYTVDW